MFPIIHLQQLLIHGQMFHVYPYPLQPLPWITDANSRHGVISFVNISVYIFER